MEGWEFINDKIEEKSLLGGVLGHRFESKMPCKNKVCKTLYGS